MDKDAMSKGSRSIEIDVARGCLMAYVVCIIHGIFWLKSSPGIAESFLLFEMPLIFIISGIAYRYSTQTINPANSLKSYTKWGLQRGLRILIPYWAYAIACAAFIILIDKPAPISEIIFNWLNPLQIGNKYSTLFLNWHLWFIAPFLAITLSLPLITRIPLPKTKAPLLFWWACAAGCTYLSRVIFEPFSDKIETTIFYLIWALFGYALGANPTKFSKLDYTSVLISSIVTLAVLAWQAPSGTTMDMQVNKFPPNTIFFVFCSSWVAGVLLLLRLSTVTPPVISVASTVLKPFISAGYSVYLWQGLGYSASHLISVKFGLNIAATMVLSVALTLFFGLMASPLEKIKLK